MPELHVLHKGLTEYNEDVLHCIKKVETDENKTYLNINILANLRYTFDKINLIIGEINSKIENNITSIKISELKKYYRDYDISIDNINAIKKHIRCINNRHYAKKSRDKKKLRLNNL